MIDVLLFGLPADQVGNGTPVWRKLVSIAMSAQLRGWSWTEFSGEVAKDEYRSGKQHRNGLWVQLRARSRSDAHTAKQLANAWSRAAENLAGLGDRDAENFCAEAVERSYEWSDRLDEGVDDLTDAETAVLRYVAAETERRRFMTVTCPRRAVADAAGISEWKAKEALASLTAKGYLVQASPGRGGSAANRRAAIYSLAPIENHPYTPRRVYMGGGTEEAEVSTPCVGYRLSRKNRVPRSFLRFVCASRVGSERHWRAVNSSHDQRQGTSPAGQPREQQNEVLRR
ncbi:hypothetical protein EB72_24715 [Mycobacterium sp. SWH-M1]|nr:hypothetical protein EB72_24715 [Mycobacterium sp. SWH-M1]